MLVFQEDYLNPTFVFSRNIYQQYLDLKMITDNDGHYINNSYESVKLLRITEIHIQQHDKYLYIGLYFFQLYVLYYICVLFVRYKVLIIIIMRN